MKKNQIKVLFTDLGGVLLTNGWDHKSRNMAADLFGLDKKEFESRHGLLFGDYETGKISLESYLDSAVFYQSRPFTKQVFIDFMYAQSAPFLEMIDLVKRLKSQYGLKVVAISNEGKELTVHRMKTFMLPSFIDFFIVSCFIGIRKPDRQVYKMALDLTQVQPLESVYLEDRELFVEMANGFGIHAIHHKDLKETEEQLSKLLQAN